MIVNIVFAVFACYNISGYIFKHNGGNRGCNKNIDKNGGYNYCV